MTICRSACCNAYGVRQRFWALVADYRDSTFVRVIVSWLFSFRNVAIDPYQLF